MFHFGANGGFITPEIRAALVIDAKQSRPFTNSGFSGTTGSAYMQGVDPGRTYWRMGAGVAGRFNQCVDFNLDYNYSTRSGYSSHQLTAALGLNF